ANFAREYWKQPAAALGRRIKNAPNDPWRTIVGVAGDERDDGLAKPAPAIVFWPLVIRHFWNSPVDVRRGLTYAIRTERPKSPTLMKEIQQAVWSVNGNLPVANVRTLPEIMSRSMAQTSFALVMLAIAAGVALALGVVGIYGVIAYVAAQRTKEIGIRIALGAVSRDVASLFVRHGLLLAGVGIALGMAAAAAATRIVPARNPRRPHRSRRSAAAGSVTSIRSAGLPPSREALRRDSP
ncbi:MAG: multidrug ABC transporter substrate-binding protein, partial [Acidobacteria bacterium]